MEEIKKLLEDCECTGYRCPHEISGKHYVMIPEDVDDLIDLAVSKERSRIVERVMKDAEEKHSGHEDWEYGDCDCDSLYDYKDVINLINTK